MFSALEDLFFKFVNMTLRADFLDWFLPLFESSLPVFLVTVGSIFLFAIYCKKTYGEFFYRFLLFMGMIVLSAFFAKQLAKTIYIERPRPYQEIAGTMFYDEHEKTWMQAQYAVEDVYPPVNTEFVDNTANDTRNTDNAIESDISTDDAFNQEIISSDQENNNSNEQPSIVEDTTNNLTNDVADTQSTMSTQNQLANKTPTFVIHGQAKLQPSSVIAISMAIALVIALLVAKAMPYIYLFPLLIGWSQIYTGNAYVSDLIVGWIVAIIAVFFAWACFALFFKYAARLN